MKKKSSFMNDKLADIILGKLSDLHPNAGCELEYKTTFELLVAVILSAQCTDKRVNQITKELFKKHNTPSQLALLEESELEPIIYSCGFFKNKSRNIIDTSKIILNDYQGEVPSNMDDLLKLPGVGRKTASVIQSVAFDIPAMPVDTHVYRTSKRIGFSSGKNVEEVERDLKKIFIESKWNPLHHTLIFHGRYICKSQKPLCENCNITQFCEAFKAKIFKVR